jgi:acetyl esterase
MKAFAGTPEPVARVEKIRVPRRDGSELAGELYMPDSVTPLPIMVYMHGGGWVIGDHTAVDSLVRTLVRRSGWAILSIDYRLAPEHRYPAALEDVLYALKWVVASADQWGFDSECVAVGGDSSGANLAAAASLHCRDQAGPQLAFQLLVYPALDHDYQTESYRRFGDGLLSALSRDDAAWFQDQYVHSAEELDSPYVSPLRANSFANLPSTLLICAEIDPLVDEGLEYARRLANEKVPVDVRVYAGMFHGFWRMGGVLDEARKAIDDVGEWMKQLVRLA